MIKCDPMVFPPLKGLRNMAAIGVSLRCPQHATDHTAAARVFFTCTLLLLACLAAGRSSAQGPVPLPAFSDDDFDRPRPLFSALQLRFAALEVDLHLVGGELRVGAGAEDLMQGRTLGNLYLEPLRLIVTGYSGQVYLETTTPLLLLLDLKTDVAETYGQLTRALAPYERFLTRFTTDGMEPGAVTVIVRGEGVRSLMAAQPERFAAAEGSVADLRSGTLEPFLTPVVSAEWGEVFEWRGSDQMPEDQQQRLRSLSDLARSQNVRLRFRDAPDIPPVWEAQLEAGIPLVGASRIEALAETLGR